MDKYYFVVCEYRPPYLMDSGTGVSNVIIKNIHPLAWAANPPESFTRTRYITYIHWWSEIDEAIALDASVRNHFSVED